MNLVAWRENLNRKLVQKLGEKKGGALYRKYGGSFDVIYSEECSVDMALNDISYLETISAENFLELDFYLSPDKQENTLHLRLYKWDKFIPLADILPILSDLDFRAWSERSYRVVVEKQVVWISDFVVSYAHASEFRFEKTRQLFRDA